jgi:hypothetical protein
MKLFRLPKRDLGRFEEDTLLLKIIRAVLILLLFGAVCYGVWLNSQKQEALRRKSAPSYFDKSGSLMEDQQKIAAGYREKSGGQPCSAIAGDLSRSLPRKTA